MRAVLAQLLHEGHRSISRRSCTPQGNNERLNDQNVSFLSSYVTSLLISRSGSRNLTSSPSVPRAHARFAPFRTAQRTMQRNFSVVHRTGMSNFRSSLRMPTERGPHPAESAAFVPCFI